MSATKEYLFQACETLGIDPTEASSWNIVDQLENHRATIVGVKCGYGRSGSTFRFRFLVTYARGLFLASRDVTCGFRRHVIPSRDPAYLIARRDDRRQGETFDCVSTAQGERILSDADLRGVLIWGPTEADARRFVESQLSDRLGYPVRFEWL
jgi:hypothetical protein